MIYPVTKTLIGRPKVDLLLGTGMRGETRYNRCATRNEGCDLHWVGGLTEAIVNGSLIPVPNDCFSEKLAELSDSPEP